MKRKALLILSGAIIAGLITTLVLLKVLSGGNGGEALPETILIQTGQVSVPRERIIEAYQSFTRDPSLTKAAFLGSCLHGSQVDEGFGRQILATLIGPQVRYPSRIRVNEPVTITCVLGKWFPLHGLEFSYEVRVSNERKGGTFLPAQVRCDLGKYSERGEYKETVVVKCSYRPYKSSMLDPDTFVGEPGHVVYRCEVRVPVRFVIE